MRRGRRTSGGAYGSTAIAAAAAAASVFASASGSLASLESSSSFSASRGGDSGGGGGSSGGGGLVPPPSPPPSPPCAVVSGARARRFSFLNAEPPPTTGAAAFTPSMASLQASASFRAAASSDRTPAPPSALVTGPRPPREGAAGTRFSLDDAAGFAATRPRPPREGASGRYSIDDAGGAQQLWQQQELEQRRPASIDAGPGGIIAPAAARRKSYVITDILPELSVAGGSGSGAGSVASLQPRVAPSQRRTSGVISVEGTELMRKLQELDRDYGLTEGGDSPAMLPINALEGIRSKSSTQPAAAAGPSGSGLGFAGGSGSGKRQPAEGSVAGSGQGGAAGRRDGGSGTGAEVLLAGLGENMRKASGSASRFQQQDATERRKSEDRRRSVDFVAVGSAGPSSGGMATTASGGGSTGREASAAAPVKAAEQAGGTGVMGGLAAKLSRMFKGRKE